MPDFNEAERGALLRMVEKAYSRSAMLCAPARQIMCLAIPGKVLEVACDADGVRMGRTNFGGVIKQVCLEYTPEVQVGDYVLVHVGVAIGTVDKDEAAKTYRLLVEMGQLDELNVPDVDSPTGKKGASP